LIRYFYRDEQLDLSDGVKIIWSDRWIHVRGSNTEPIVRIVTEAENEHTATALTQEILEYLRPATNV
jgi:phosphomannomutase